MHLASESWMQVGHKMVLDLCPAAFVSHKTCMVGCSLHPGAMRLERSCSSHPCMNLQVVLPFKRY